MKNIYLNLFYCFYVRLIKIKLSLIFSISLRFFKICFCLWLFLSQFLPLFWRFDWDGEKTWFYVFYSLLLGGGNCFAKYGLIELVLKNLSQDMTEWHTSKYYTCTISWHDHRSSPCVNVRWITIIII